MTDIKFWHNELRGAKRSEADAVATLERLRDVIKQGEKAEVRGVAAMIANTAAADDPIEINHLIARGAIAKRAIPRAEQDLAEARQEINRIATELHGAAKREVVAHAEVLVAEYNRALSALHVAYERLLGARATLFGDAAAPSIDAPKFRLVHAADIGIDRHGPMNSSGDPHQRALKVGARIQAAIDALVEDPNAAIDLLGDSE
jgi:hypothetical protein